jgi:phosphoglycolate phosphatase
VRASGLIVFDLDGTLVDSNPDLVASVNHVRGQFALAPLTGDSIRGMIGDGAEMLVRRTLGADCSEEDVAAGLEVFLSYYREHMLDETRLYPGVLATLDALSDHKLAVLTNKPWRFSCLMLEGLGIYGRFAAVYGGNSFSEKKPHPTGIHQIQADTDSEPDATWMVGDSSVDVLTGRNAGVRTCGVTYGYAAHTFADYPPDVRIDRIEELTGVVSGLTGSALR